MFVVVFRLVLALYRAWEQAGVSGLLAEVFRFLRQPLCSRQATQEEGEVVAGHAAQHAPTQAPPTTLAIVIAEAEASAIDAHHLTDLLTW